MKIYLAGCGKIGMRLGAWLREQLVELSDEKHEVIGLKRAPADVAFPVTLVDLGDKHAVENLFLDADVIVFTVTPSSYDEASYRHVYDTVLGNVIDWAERHTQPPLVLLVSSTGVYGQQNGEWVDETSVAQPERATSQWILSGEQQLRARQTNCVIVRCSGIYGNGRNRLIEKAKSIAQSGEAIQQTPPQWTNRIHEDDVVGVLAFLVVQYQQGRALDNVYLASDDTPVSQYDVLAFIAEQLGLPTPPVKKDNLSTKLNKRCRNDKLKALGYQFKYPRYQLGYAEMIKWLA